MTARASAARAVATALLLPALAMIVLLLPRVEAAKRPNIVLVLADDMGVGHLDTEQGRASGQYDPDSGAPIQTDGVRGLSSNGLVFDRMYADGPVCSASRYALLTGIQSGSKYSRVRGNRGTGSDHALKANKEQTFVELLRQAGYATAGFGKWGFTDKPSDCGFDYFLGQRTHKDAQRFFAESLYEDDGSEARYTTAFTPKNTGISVGTDEIRECDLQGDACDYIPDVMHAEAVRWMRDTGAAAVAEGRPFFVFYSTPIPHDGGGAWSRVGNMYPVPSLSGPPGCTECVDYTDIHEDYSDQMAAMGSSMSNYFDRQMVDLSATLGDMGVEEDTLLVIVSDNGPAINIANRYEERGHILDAPMNANGPFRGYKRQLFEGALRIPNLFRWPGVISGARSHPTVVQLSDLAPTFLELAGVPPAVQPPQFSGKSFATALVGEERGADPTAAALHAYLFNELCWQDVGELGKHIDCDFAVTFGDELQYRAEWTARNDLDQSMPDVRRGFTTSKGNLTMANLLVRDPRVHLITDESIDIATPELLEEARNLVLQHRIVPKVQDREISTPVPTLFPSSLPTTAPTTGAPSLGPTSGPSASPTTSQPTLGPSSASPTLEVGGSTDLDTSAPSSGNAPGSAAAILLPLLLLMCV